MKQEVINKDCIQGLSELADNSIDCIITDPPYGVGKNYGDFKDNLTEVIVLMEKILPEMKRVCKGTILIYASMKHIKDWLKLNPDRLMFFIKDYIQIFPTTIQWATDLILVFFGDEKPPNKPMIRDWFHLTTADTSKKPRFNHPSIKPLNAMRYLIKTFTKEGDIVLDCFMGSGTTAVACRQLNRNCIGFEINPEYCKIAEKRLSQKSVSGFNPLNEESLIRAKPQLIPSELTLDSTSRALRGV